MNKRFEIINMEQWSNGAMEQWSKWNEVNRYAH